MLVTGTLISSHSWLRWNVHDLIARVRSTVVYLAHVLRCDCADSGRPNYPVGLRGDYYSALEPPNSGRAGEQYNLTRVRRHLWSRRAISTRTDLASAQARALV